MKESLNKIKLAIKNKDYKNALEIINKTALTENSEELVFYKAYTLGELKYAKESIDLYRILIEKNESLNYLQGIVRILDKHKEFINEDTISYFKKLNKLEIKDERREINDRTILEFYLENKSELWREICCILEHRANYQKTKNIFSKNIIGTGFMKNYLETLCYNIIKEYKFRLNQIDNEKRPFKEKINMITELYSDTKILQTSQIYSFNFLENIIFEIGKLYVTREVELSNKIIYDLFFVLELIPRNLWNDEEFILQSMLKRIHASEIKNLISDHNDLYLCINTNINTFIKDNFLIICIFIYEFFLLDDFLLKNDFVISENEISIVQKYFSPSLQILMQTQYNFQCDSQLNDIIQCNDQLNINFQCNNQLNKLRFYFKNKQINKLFAEYKKLNNALIEAFYYYLNFLKYSSTQNDYCDIIENFYKSLNLHYNQNDQILILEKWLFLLETCKERSSLDYTILFFESKYSIRFVYLIISELICYFLKYSLIEKESIKQLMKYFNDSMFDDKEYHSKILYCNYKLTGMKEYLIESINLDSLNYFSFEEHLLLFDYHSTEKKKCLLNMIEDQKKLQNSSQNDDYEESELFLYEIDSRYVVELANVYAQEKNNLQAYSVLKNNVRHEKKYYSLMGRLTYHMQKFTESELYLKKSVMIDSTFLCCLYLARIYFATNRFNMASLIFDGIKPESVFSMIEKARILNKIGKHKEAIEILENNCMHQQPSFINDIMNYEKLKGLIFEYEECGQDNSLKIDEFFNLTNKNFKDEVNLLRIYYENLQSIFDSSKILITAESMMVSYENGDSDNYKCCLNNALYFHINHQNDKALLYLEKCKFFAKKSFLFYFLEYKIGGKHITMVIDHIIENFKLKHFQILSHIVCIYIRAIDVFNNLLQVIDIFERCHKIYKFTNCQNELLGRLYLLNGDIENSRKFMNKNNFEQVYQKYKTYIETGKI